MLLGQPLGFGHRFLDGGGDERDQFLAVTLDLFQLFFSLLDLFLHLVNGLLELPHVLPHLLFLLLLLLAGDFLDRLILLLQHGGHQKEDQQQKDRVDHRCHVQLLVFVLFGLKSHGSEAFDAFPGRHLEIEFLDIAGAHADILEALERGDVEGVHQLLERGRAGRGSARFARRRCGRPAPPLQHPQDRLPPISGRSMPPAHPAERPCAEPKSAAPQQKQRTRTPARSGRARPSRPWPEAFHLKIGGARALLESRIYPVSGPRWSCGGTA